jgi:transcriptional regulator with XRE-family HTH domain
MKNLREMVKAYRSAHNLSTRELAGEIGIPKATLNRFERSSDGMSAESLATMICWLLSKDRRLSRGTR